MPLATFFVFIFLFHLFLLNSADSKCQKSFHCGDNGTREFPLFDYMQPKCGLFMVDCNTSNPRIRLGDGERWYDIMYKLSKNKFMVKDPVLQVQLNDKNCSSFANLSLPNSLSSSFTVSPNLTLFICSNHPNDREYTEDCFENYLKYTGCGISTVYYRNRADTSPTPESNIPRGCSVIQLPVKPNLDSHDLFDQLTAEFSVELNVSHECYDCYYKGSQCGANSKNEFVCNAQGKSWSTVILATAISGGGVLLLLCLLIWQCKKRFKSACLLSRNINSDPSSKSDIEGGSCYFGISIFSYTELEEATNNFDSSKELGDGGFGTVYYGKLRDRREVAIKRLYKHNCRRVEQFMNEIKILACLRHQNLVSLYGCTSRRSKELLLVYEYIPNGTVADHLHGDRANEAPLTWAVRMNIAIETASALAYLHKSDIIHRDVKTNNILLDNNFCVKVADFGLSRLFPNDVTHISTAPQGTPGYVDPEYHQCYQLTDKSDVYSFGVVLIELISSMPAVDISRHRHEINLANLAVNRIRRCAFDELIDSSLGYESDVEVIRMTTSVAELAFRCLQLDKDMRPSMDEVLNFLKEIQGGEESEI